MTHRSVLAVSASGFNTGLTGTIGVTVYDELGNTVLARTTRNVMEHPVVSGSYYSQVAVPTAAIYWVKWDDGSGTSAYEVLSSRGNVLQNLNLDPNY